MLMRNCSRMLIHQNNILIGYKWKICCVNCPRYIDKCQASRKFSSHTYWRGLQNQNLKFVKFLADEATGNIVYYTSKDVSDSLRLIIRFNLKENSRILNIYISKSVCVLIAIWLFIFTLHNNWTKVQMVWYGAKR